MRKNNLLNELIASSSPEMQNLLRRQFGFYSVAQGAVPNVPANYAVRPGAFTPPRIENQDDEGSEQSEDPEESEEPEAAEGLTYNTWQKYFRALRESVAAAKASAGNLPSKRARAQEYDQKVKAIIAEFNDIWRSIPASRKKSGGNTIIDNSLILGSSGGVTGPGRAGGRRGREEGGPAGMDLSSDSQGREYFLVPFGDYIDFREIIKAKLITESNSYYADFKRAFSGTSIDRDSFGNLQDVKSYMRAAAATNPYPHLVSLKNLVFNIHNNWTRNGRSSKSLPQEFRREQDRIAREWMVTIDDLINEAKQDQQRTENPEEQYQPRGRLR